VSDLQKWYKFDRVLTTKETEAISDWQYDRYVRSQGKLYEIRFWILRQWWKIRW